MSKWTAVHPRDQGKRFLVIRVISPEASVHQIVMLVLEAVLTRCRFTLGWTELADQRQLAARLALNSPWPTGLGANNAQKPDRHIKTRVKRGFISRAPSQLATVTDLNTHPVMEIPLGVERQVMGRCGNCGNEYFAPALPPNALGLRLVDPQLGEVNSPLFPKALIVIMLICTPLPLMLFFIHFFFWADCVAIHGRWKKLPKVVFWIVVEMPLVPWLQMLVKDPMLKWSPLPVLPSPCGGAVRSALPAPPCWRTVVGGRCVWAIYAGTKDVLLALASARQETRVSHAAYSHFASRSSYLNLLC